jgi:hypothetical protein
MFPGALPPCLVRSGWHGCSRVLPGPGAPLPPHASRSRQRGKRLRKRTLAATPAVAGMQSPWRAPAPQDGSTIAARVAAPGARFPLQASRTRKRENGRVDADTWFQTTLPSRKSPNLSNTERVWRPIAYFYFKNILVECIRHNRGSKSAIQSPLNLPEEPSRLWLDGCRSASRSSRMTPSGELENSSMTSP